MIEAKQISPRWEPSKTYRAWSIHSRPWIARVWAGYQSDIHSSKAHAILEADGSTTSNLGHTLKTIQVWEGYFDKDEEGLAECLRRLELLEAAVAKKEVS